MEAPVQTLLSALLKARNLTFLVHLLLLSCRGLLVQLLMAALTKTHTEIDDHVTYMRRPVKVWLSEMWDEKARKGTL